MYAILVPSDKDGNYDRIDEKNVSFLSDDATIFVV